MILKRNKKGFTIIEVVFAVGLISVSFVGLMSLFAYNLRMEMLTRDKITAVYLAQEGIEIVKQVRDNDWFEGAWVANVPLSDEVIVVANDLDKIYEGFDLRDVSSESEDRKKIYLYNGQYIQSDSDPGAGWEETGFSRSLEITDPSVDPSNAEVLKIISRVTYSGGEVELVSYVYNGWY